MLGNCLISFAQNSSVAGAIPSLFYKGRITNRFDYNLFASTTFITTKSTVDGQPLPARNSEIYIQPSLVYKYSSELNVSVGYTYTNGNNFHNSRETEQQVWQQIIFEHRIFKGAMLHRLRCVENLSTTITPALNYQIAFERPLQGRVLDNGEFYFTCLNESFINLSSNASRVYQANWFFFGVGYKTAKAGKFELGPLVQTAFHSEGAGHDTLYLLQILWIGDSQLFNYRK
jgi:hypothetical protein